MKVIIPDPAFVELDRQVVVICDYYRKNKQQLPSVVGVVSVAVNIPWWGKPLGWLTGYTNKQWTITSDTLHARAKVLDATPVPECVNRGFGDVYAVDDLHLSVAILDDGVVALRVQLNKEDTQGPYTITDLETLLVEKPGVFRTVANRVTSYVSCIGVERY